MNLRNEPARTRFAITARLGLGAVAFACAATVASCGGDGGAPTEPKTAPYMAGRITSVTQASTFSGSIRVEAIPSSPNAGLKAVARIDGVTTVLLIDSKEGEFRSLAVGQWVRLWLDGEILESYPVQGVAGTVKIDSLGVTPLSTRLNDSDATIARF